MAYDTDSLVCEVEFRQIDWYQEGTTPTTETGFKIDGMARPTAAGELRQRGDAPEITTAFRVYMTPETNSVWKTEYLNKHLYEERSSPDKDEDINPPELDNQYEDQTDCGPTIASTPATISLNGNEQDAEVASSDECHVQIECHENSSSDKEYVCCAAQCLCQ